jgi:3-dehydrosphinganine reductase
VEDVEVAAEDPVPLAVTAIKAMPKLNGKSVFIAGGSSGIGLALAKIFSLKQCRITLLARDDIKLQAAKNTLESLPHFNSSICTIHADISDYASLEAAITPWLKHEGVPDIAVNSAGISQPGRFQDLPLDKFHWMMNTNYYGAVHVTQLLLPEMLKRNAGHLVYISSVAGFLGMYGYTAYAPTKFAVKGFVDSLRTELYKSGVNLSIVFPPDTETPSLAYEKLYQPPILVAINETSPPVSADLVARNIYSGIEKGRYIITPSFDAALLFKLVGLLGGGLVYRVVNIFLEDAIKKVTKNPAKYRRQPPK